MKRPIIITICIIAALAAWSCESDKTTPSAPVVPDPYKSLKSQDDILHNLELAYNERNITEFEKLLDESFEFYFSEADFNSGAVQFENWGRLDELNTNQRLFDASNPNRNRVISIFLELDFESGDWTPESPDSVHAGETWYTKVTTYRCVIKTADSWEYRALDLKALFKIRKDDGGRWRIVEWYDDFESGRLLGHAPLVQGTTWGGIKAQYYVRSKNDG